LASAFEAAGPVNEDAGAQEYGDPILDAEFVCIHTVAVA
jgi:hypothetical protein